MTLHSTRSKLRDQADRTLQAVTKALAHIQFLDELANEESDYINMYLPMLVASLLEWVHGFEQFKEGL